MFLGSKAQPVRRAGNLAAFCEPIVYTMWDPHHLTTRSATGIALLYLVMYGVSHCSAVVPVTLATDTSWGPVRVISLERGMQCDTHEKQQLKFFIII
jgi:hypothetical protein